MVHQPSKKFKWISIDVKLHCRHKWEDLGEKMNKSYKCSRSQRLSWTINWKGCRENIIAQKIMNGLNIRKYTRNFMLNVILKSNRFFNRIGDIIHPEMMPNVNHEIQLQFHSISFHHLLLFFAGNRFFQVFEHLFAWITRFCLPDCFFRLNIFSSHKTRKWNFSFCPTKKFRLKKTEEIKFSF